MTFLDFMYSTCNLLQRTFKSQRRLNYDLGLTLIWKETRFNKLQIIVGWNKRRIWRKKALRYKSRIWSKSSPKLSAFWRISRFHRNATKGTPLICGAASTKLKSSWKLFGGRIWEEKRRRSVADDERRTHFRNTFLPRRSSHAENMNQVPLRGWRVFFDFFNEKLLTET